MGCYNFFSALRSIRITHTGPQNIMVSQVKINLFSHINDAISNGTPDYAPAIWSTPETKKQLLTWKLVNGNYVYVVSIDLS